MEIKHPRKPSFQAKGKKKLSKCRYIQDVVERGKPRLGIQRTRVLSLLPTNSGTVDFLASGPKISVL